MEDKKLILSQDGLDEMTKELEERKTVIRTRIADEIEKARQQGDLSENAAYKSAMEDKDFNESRITKLEEMVSNATVQNKTKGNKAGLGNKLTLVRLSDNQQLEFTLVGQGEGDPLERKISIDSPLGTALMGKKKGDEVEVELPTGAAHYRIVNLI